MKTVAAFALGFVAGMVFLDAVLWSTGSLVTHAQAGRTVPEAIQFKETALRLARYFGTTAEYWINMQARYNLEVARDEFDAANKQIKPRTVFGRVLCPSMKICQVWKRSR